MLAVFMFVVACVTETSATLSVDEHGYVLYCPCMGRFGNQADHFLGAFSFAHGLNRTLVLPPWVEYDYSKPHSIQIPFDKYFLVEPLRKFHRVITMESFMAELAPTIWPSGKRTVYCYGARHGVKENGCNAKDGNPFGPFWDTFSVDFDKSEFYGPLDYDTTNIHFARLWNKRFPVTDHLVMAFTGAPGAFPVSQYNVELHKYLEWSEYIDNKAEAFIEEHFPGRPFLGIHMRNGQDWVNVCKHVDEGQRHLFASAQCLGYNFEHGQVTDELCFPTEDTILKQVVAAVKKMAARAIFVAADGDHMIAKLKKVLKGKVDVVQHLPAEPHIDLAILGKADHYIGNCVSTFSAFATRERRSKGKTVAFWAFKEPRPADEL